MVNSGHDARGGRTSLQIDPAHENGANYVRKRGAMLPLLRIASRFCLSGVLRPRRGYFLVVAYLNGSLTCFEDRWESVRIVDILRCCRLLSEMVAWIFLLPGSRIIRTHTLARARYCQGWSQDWSGWLQRYPSIGMGEYLGSYMFEI